MKMLQRECGCGRMRGCGEENSENADFWRRLAEVVWRREWETLVTSHFPDTKGRPEGGGGGGGGGLDLTSTVCVLCAGYTYSIIGKTPED